jgi:hypothetical protein
MLKPFTRDVPDIGLAGIQLSHFLAVHVESQDGKLLFTKPQNQGQSNITKADHTDGCPMRLNLFQQIVFDHPAYFSPL